MATTLFNLAKQDPKSEAGRRAVLQAISLLKHAQACNPDHPHIQAHLAEIRFHKKDYEQSLVLCQKAVSALESNEAQAWLNYCMGRVCHVQVESASNGLYLY
jgi:tetratricopeptide (TPR) repeat protein